MSLERSPKLLAATLIALILVLFNFQKFSLIPGEKTKQVEEGSRNDTNPLLPTAISAAHKVMANTGPGVAQAFVQATPTIFPRITSTPRTANYSPEFQRFIDKVANGQKDVVRGVYVSGLLALPVVQQPEGEWAFVSEEQGMVTEFQSAARNKVIGLLAHNYLSGALFSKFKEGNEVRIVYGNKAVKFYLIEGNYRYQKLTPSSPQSDLIDLATGEKVTTETVFNRYYRGKDHVTFQTCLEAYGLSNWGLVFTVAVPEEQQYQQ